MRLLRSAVFKQADKDVGHFFCALLKGCLPGQVPREAKAEEEGGEAEPGDRWDATSKLAARATDGSQCGDANHDGRYWHGDEERRRQDDGGGEAKDERYDSQRGNGAVMGDRLLVGQQRMGFRGRRGGHGRALTWRRTSLLKYARQYLGVRGEGFGFLVFRLQIVDSRSPRFVKSKA